MTKSKDNGNSNKKGEAMKNTLAEVGSDLQFLLDQNAAQIEKTIKKDPEHTLSISLHINLKMPEQDLFEIGTSINFVTERVKQSRQKKFDEKQGELPFEPEAGKPGREAGGKAGKKAEPKKKPEGKPPASLDQKRKAKAGAGKGAGGSSPTKEPEKKPSGSSASSSTGKGAGAGSPGSPGAPGSAPGAGNPPGKKS